MASFPPSLGLTGSSPSFNPHLDTPKMDASPSKPKPHLFFFPFMAHGHTIPILDMAKLFAKQGAKASIILAPADAVNLAKSITKLQNSGLEIHLLTIRFPSLEVGLSEEITHSDMIDSPETRDKFFQAAALLSHPLEELLKEHNPDCLVSDMFFPWSIEVASRNGVPTVIFNGTCFFSSSASECVRLYRPHKKVSSDNEPFVIPNFPGEIKMTRGRLPEFLRQESEYSKFREEVKEAEIKSRGVLVNSFYELEPEYADHFRNVLGRKAWHIGPVSLCNIDVEDKGERGKVASIDEHESLRWLDSKEPNSVVYVCFGTTANFSSSQLLEIAFGLESSGKDFIWVVKRKKGSSTSEEDWLPEGFNKRIEGRGLIIRGWAPQVLILQHKAVGGFVTHCGWNSTLEGICAGLPLVTWPVAAEQFYNERLVTEVLKIGVGVGVEKWASFVGDSVRREALEMALARIMVGEEAEEMRARAQELAKIAKKAVQEGGSSYCDLKAFIEEFSNKEL